MVAGSGSFAEEWRGLEGARERSGRKRTARKATTARSRAAQYGGGDRRGTRRKGEEGEAAGEDARGCCGATGHARMSQGWPEATARR